MAIVSENPWMLLSEIAAHLRLRMSLSKVLQCTAAHRDDLKRAAYWPALDVIISDGRMLVFADETTLDGRVMRRHRGWDCAPSPSSLGGQDLPPRCDDISARAEHVLYDAVDILIEFGVNALKSKLRCKAHNLYNVVIIVILGNS